MRVDKEVNKEYIRKGEQITLKSIVVNVLLSLIKIITGWIGNSAAILADGLHSASDLLSDFGILATIRISRQPPDHNHPYGHRKVETLTAFILGISLGIIGISFVITGIRSIVEIILSQTSYEINPIVIIGALLTVFSKEWIFRLTKKIGKELKNDAIIANAWHHRSDAFSSMGTAVGISFAVWGGAGFLILDPLMSIFVAFFIFKTAFSIIKYNGSILLDTGADAELTSAIKEIVQKIDGVRDVHGVRSRFHGNDLFVDLHVVVNPLWTVERSHLLCDEIETGLKKELEEICDVVIHIEPSTIL